MVNPMARLLASLSTPLFLYCYEDSKLKNISMRNRKATDEETVQHIAKEIGKKNGH